MSTYRSLCGSKHFCAQFTMQEHCCFIDQGGGKYKECENKDRCRQGLVVLVKKMTGWQQGSPALCHECWMLLCREGWPTWPVCTCAEGCGEIAQSLGLVSSGSGTGTSSVEPTSFSPSSPPLPRWCLGSSLPPPPPPLPTLGSRASHLLLFCRLQSSLAEVLDRVHKVTERSPRIELFGSVLAGLDDPQSDLDILCFFPDGKDVDRQDREFCLHVAFGLVGQHFKRMASKEECSGVEELWHK